VNPEQSPVTLTCTIFTMDAVLRNFKSIPCPSGDKCTKTGCQWQHSWDKTPVPSTPHQGGPSGSPGGSHGSHGSHGLDGTQDQEGPRKRQKVSSGPGECDSRPSTALKPVSPPPLKRKLPPPSSTTLEPRTPPPAAASASASSKHGKQSQVQQKATTPGRLGPATSTSQQAAPRKPESLNPRHLKTSAPATHDFRCKALKMLHDQLERLNNELKKSSKASDKKLLLSSQDLIWLALDEEEKLATDKPAIYNNVIKNRITVYKRSTVDQWREEREAAELKMKQILEGTPGTKRAQSRGAPKEINTGLTPSEEVRFLEHLLTPIDKLAPYGYVPTPPSDADIAKAAAGQEASKGWEVCDRCSSRFQVFPGRRDDGTLTSGGPCVYHHGRAYYPDREPGQVGQQEKRYRCCATTVGESPGCVKDPSHVFKANAPSRLAALVPFIETPPNPLAPKDRAVCFDCEMGYTSRGMELIRLTATSWPDGKELLDVLVQPIGEIIDLNSRYSGVLPEDFKFAVQTDKVEEAKEAIRKLEDPRRPVVVHSRGNSNVYNKRKTMQVVSSPVVARKLLFSLISPQTPLIGHGLENDLNAVRIIHPTIVDTILLYPHRRGLPIRNGLRSLMEQHLNKAIQVETGDPMGGHDSAEDARAAGELVRLKVQEKWKAMQTFGWVKKDGKFVSPSSKRVATGGGGLSEAYLEGA